MAVAPRNDELERQIAALKAQVDQLTAALDAKSAKVGSGGGPLFGHGISGGLLGGLEVAVGVFALTILLFVVRHLMSVE